MSAAPLPGGRFFLRGGEAEGKGWKAENSMREKAFGFSGGGAAS